jgi:hypothetical protein
MARFLHDAGLCGAESLALTAEIWRAHPMEPDTHWSNVRDLNVRTLQELDGRGLLKEQPQDAYRWIATEWQFPIYALDLTKIPVALDDLRERQRNWNPGWY